MNGLDTVIERVYVATGYRLTSDDAAAITHAQAVAGADVERAIVKIIQQTRRTDLSEMVERLQWFGEAVA